MAFAPAPQAMQERFQKIKETVDRVGVLVNLLGSNMDVGTEAARRARIAGIRKEMDAMNKGSGVWAHLHALVGTYPQANAVIPPLVHTFVAVNTTTLENWGDNHVLAQNNYAAAAGYLAALGQSMGMIAGEPNNVAAGAGEGGRRHRRRKTRRHAKKKGTRRR